MANYTWNIIAHIILNSFGSGMQDNYNKPRATSLMVLLQRSFAHTCGNVWIAVGRWTRIFSMCIPNGFIEYEPCEVPFLQWILLLMRPQLIPVDSNHSTAQHLYLRLFLLENCQAHESVWEMTAISGWRCTNDEKVFLETKTYQKLVHFCFRGRTVVLVGNEST